MKNLTFIILSAVSIMACGQAGSNKELNQKENSMQVSNKLKVAEVLKH